MNNRPPKSRPATQPGPEKSPETGESRPVDSGLLANISHEMRTPMDAILGYVDLLNETPLSDIQQTYVSAIEAASRGLLDIMDDALDLSRMQAGKLVINVQPFSIRNCTEGVAQLLAPSAYRKGIDFVQLTDSDVPENFVGDPLRIRQILVNLVGNAIKFTQTGEVRLRISAAPLDEQRFELIIRVIDTGIGISADDMPELFEPFSQPGRPQGEIAGTGLGLVISRNLCEAMGGKIEVKSTPGAGSTFTVSIPLESMATRTQAALNSDLLAGWRVFVVGSDAVHAGWIAENLRHYGAGTQVFRDMQQLSRAINSGQEAGDAALIVVTAHDLLALQGLERDWQATQVRLPVLSLASAVSSRVLGQVATALPGDAIAAHSSIATVAVRLAAMLQQRDAEAEDTGQSTPVQQQLAGLSLLVAEDNQFGRDYLQMLLRGQGARVDVCQDGLDACRMIDEYAYDLVLMDVRMPQCDGIEAMRRLTESGKPFPPVVGLTAAPEECCKAISAGMTDCLLKPVRPALLLRYLSKHRGEAVRRRPRSPSFIDAAMRADLNRELPQRGADLLQAILAGDLQSALDTAHKLNGTAALCGFSGLRATAAAIEASIRQQQLDGIERLTRKLDEQIRQALASLTET